MKARFVIFKGLKFLVFGAAISALLGSVVMGLWNWLVPVLFHGPIISFWQAIGLFALSKILFGGWGRNHGWGEGRHAHWKQRFEDRMANMTPEEKEKFKQNMQERWGKRCGRSFAFDYEKDRSTNNVENS
jgi:hypothetical protein